MNDPFDSNSYDSLLEQLYHGRIYPSEQIVPDSPEYKEDSKDLQNYISQNIKVLAATNSEEEISNILDELADLYLRKYSNECYDHYVYGYKMGVRLMLEALGGNLK